MKLQTGAAKKLTVLTREGKHKFCKELESKFVGKMLFKIFSKIWEYNSVVEHLCRLHMSLSLIPSTRKRKGKKREGKKEERKDKGQRKLREHCS